MVQPLVQPEELAAGDQRVNHRTHLFVVATLSAGKVSTPVVIRNLSASGALVEGSVLPDVGTAVEIRRASLAVEGLVAWQSKNQAGIAFKSLIDVRAWLSRKGGSGQGTVDRIVFDTKYGSVGNAAPPELACVPAGRDEALAELEVLRNELVKLGDALVQDIVLVAAHPEIQTLDIAIQRIDRLAELTRARK